MSGWQPIASAPRDAAFLFCEAGNPPVYIGRYGRPAAGNVLHEECLCYLSYTDTVGKTYFRLAGMIRCGLKPTHWMALPEAAGAQ